MVRLCITTECVCDLPEELLKSLNVAIIYFHINTDSGCFRDTDEIDAHNILEYIENGGKMSKSAAPTANEYKNFFQRKLEDFNEIIHIAISSGISEAVKNASLAAAKMGIEGRKVHIFDSAHLSSGMGLMVMKAAQLNQNGCSTKHILEELEHMKGLISTSFIVRNANYLFRNGKVGKGIMQLCNIFSLHPVLYMKNGVLTLKGVEFGNYEKAGMHYLKKELRHAEKIDKEYLFITHAGCLIKKMEQLKKGAEECCAFKHVIVNSASATVSSNCGPDTFGVLFALIP